MNFDINYFAKIIQNPNGDLTFQTITSPPLPADRNGKYVLIGKPGEHHTEIHSISP